MPRRLFLLLLAIILATPGIVHAKSNSLKIVATVPSLASIATDVAGDRGQVESLALASQDPHFVDARPHLALSLSRPTC